MVAKKLGIGKNNVQYRVQKLVENKIIKKFVTQASIGKLGLFAGKIYLQLSGYSKEDEDKIYKYLQEDTRITWIAKCEGRWDLLIAVYVASMDEFIEIKKDFFKKYEKFVAGYNVVFIAEAHTSQRTYLIPGKSSFSRNIKHFVSKEIVTLDETDKKILKAIANDARFNYMALARKFDMNIKTIQKRIARMEKAGVIRGYVTFLDTKKMGYNFFKLCIYLKDYENGIESFIRYCLEHPNVLHVIESFGPWEIELEIETENSEQFYAITHEIRNRFPGIIKKTESVIISDELKLNFLPEKF
jgi:Lrp/AsnC family leucine-responsive transcriptional regulator